MKLKYYLRGLGFGILLATLVFLMANRQQTGAELTDAEIIERAQALGMVMKNSGVSVDYDAINESINGNTTDEEVQEEEDSVNSSEMQEASQDLAPNNDLNKDGESEDEASESEQTSILPESENNEENKDTTVDSESEEEEETVSDSSQSSETATENSNNNEDGNQEEVVEMEPVVKKITIRPGMTAKEVSYLLEEHGIISNAYSFNSYLIDQGLTNQIISQKVEIAVNADFKTIAEILTHSFKN